MGHALHVWEPAFRDYSRSAEVAGVALELGYRSPVMPQSMYIFKQSEIGEEVSSHQDATFLNTEGRITCLGLLLFLEDAALRAGRDAR